MTMIPEHIILDLLPLYLAEELGPETRAVVEEYLNTHEEFAARVRAAGTTSYKPGADVAGSDPGSLPDIEIRSVSRTRRVLAMQRWLFGLAIGFSAIGLSLAASYRGGRVTSVHLMLRDYPLPLGACLVIAAACWLGYHNLRQKGARGWHS